MKFEIEKGRAQSIPGIRDLVENDLFLLLVFLFPLVKDIQYMQIRKEDAVMPEKQKASGRKVRAVSVKKRRDEDYGDGFVEHISETRFVIVDDETGEVLDNAQGYGYKSAQNAYRGWNYKSKSKKQQKHIKNTRKKIRAWMEEHADFFDGLENDVFHAEKAGYDITKQDFIELMDAAPDDVLKTMPCTKDELWKFWRK